MHEKESDSGGETVANKPGVAVLTVRPTNESKSLHNPSPSTIRLFKQDIQGSIAHANMLARVGLLNDKNASKLCEHCRKYRLISKKDAFHLSGREDVHMHIEAALVEKLGDIGRKLHTGRSRNDQVATDLKLWVREASG